MGADLAPSPTRFGFSQARDPLAAPLPLSQLPRLAGSKRVSRVSPVRVRMCTQSHRSRQIRAILPRRPLSRITPGLERKRRKFRFASVHAMRTGEVELMMTFYTPLTGFAHRAEVFIIPLWHPSQLSLHAPRNDRGGIRNRNPIQPAPCALPQRRNRVSTN